MTYKPPYQITTKMTNYISDIMKSIGFLSTKTSINDSLSLRKKSKISSIYSSLAIENNLLSLTQVKDIINGKMVIGQQRDIIEVKNALKVYDQVLNINPYKVDDLLKCHKIMMESLIDFPGMFRQQNEGVFDGDKVIFMAPPPNLVPKLMNELFDYLVNYEENMLIKSCVFHYEFEFIHPFVDGNGRIGRFFQTALLSNWEPLFAYLPIESIIKEKQQEYYDAIALCNKLGNSNVFIEFMLETILMTIRKFSINHEKDNLINNSYVEKLMSIMEDKVAYSTRQLMDLLNLKSRVSFRSTYLLPALDLKLIRMTYPNVPNSKNQKYIKIVT